MKKLVISNSMLRSLGTCSTQAWLRTNGYSAGTDDNKAARAGRDAHASFEKWHRGAHVHDCIQAFLTLYQPFSDMYLLSKDKYHHENLARILEVFFATNSLSTLPYEIIETEKQIEYSLGVENGIEYVVSDKSDALGRMRDGGAIMSVECKTTGFLGPDYIRDYDLDSQITTHVAAARANGIDAKGVILQAINFNKLPDPNAVVYLKKKGVLTGEVRPVTCRTANHGPVSNCWTQHVNFQRFIVTRTQEDINIWLDNVKERIFKYHSILEMHLEAVPQEGLFGRCGHCEFAPFCKGHRQNLDSLFTREREEGILYSGFHG